jgi:hypothetical protein
MINFIEKLFERKTTNYGLPDKPTKIPMPSVKPPREESNTKLEQLKQKLYDISVGLDLIHYNITDREVKSEYDELKEDVRECIRIVDELENKNK